MGVFGRTLTAVLALALAAAAGCGTAGRSAAREGAAVLVFHAERGRLSWIRTTMNRAGPEVPMTGEVSAAVPGVPGAAVHSSPEDARGAAALAEWLGGAYAFFRRFGFDGLPAVELDVRRTPSLPSEWRASLEEGRLRAPLFCTSGAPVRTAGRWKRLDDAAAAQLLGIFHELLERAMLFGGGPRLKDGRLRWLREGLATFLPARALDEAFVCDPFRGSKLETKYYYATAYGAKLLRWTERKGVSWNAAYAASLGFMYAAYEATRGRFPVRFLAGLKEGREPRALLAEVLGCDPARFAASIRRPVPGLLPAAGEEGLRVPDGFESADVPGLKVGDVLLSVDGRRVTTQRELDEALWRAGAKEEFIITVRRAGAVLDLPCMPVRPRNALEGRER